MAGRILLILLACLAIGAVWTVIVIARHAAAQRVAELRACSELAPTRHGDIEYALRGVGPPVLVVHGAGGGFDQGLLLADELVGAGHLRVAVSRFGYLRSAMPKDPSVSAQAEAFADLLDHLKIDRIDIVAISGGVPPVLKFAEAYPERTGRLVLLSSAPFTPHGADVAERPIPSWAYASLLGSDAAYFVLSKVARANLADMFDARADLREDLAHSEQQFVEAMIDGFFPASHRLAGINNEAAAVDPQTTYDLAAIAAPTFVVHAQDDRMNPFAIGRAIAEAIPQAEFTALPSGGHLLLGHHKALSARIERFLASD